MAEIEPVRKSVTVAATPERCFRTFVEQIHRWWPKQHHIGSSPLVKTIIEPAIGGRWYSTHEDGSETNTGRVIAYDPPHRVLLTWQLDADWKYDPNFRTEIEVVFIAEAEKRTRVELTHRGLEAFGKRATELRAQLDADNAWVGILELFHKEVIS